MSRHAESVFAQDTLSTRKTLVEAIAAAKSDGCATAIGLLSLKALAEINYEANRVPKVLRRNIDEWHNTKRATFVPKRQISWKQPYFLAAIAKMWMPTAVALSNELTPIIQRNGLRDGLSSLTDFQPNRLGVNYMHGSVADPAVIPDHTDPINESGLVVAVNLGNTVDHQDPGAINLILSKDTCDELGIAQPVHNVHADTFRLGLTIAELRI